MSCPLAIIKENFMLEESIMTTEGNNDSDELVEIYEQHSFVNSLIDFEEEVDEWNSRDIFPAFPTKNCYIPIPPDSGSSSGMR